MGLIDEAGNSYGRLKVIKRARNTKCGQTQWLCRCECGQQTIVRGALLRTGKTKSCGCLKIDNQSLPKGVAAFNKLLYKYKRDAKLRGHEWRLTKRQFTDLVNMPCHYCGAEPSQIWDTPATNGTYTYNGIDRKDNNMGYTTSNSVPCCGVCNRAKSDMGYLDFLGFIMRVHNKLRNDATVTLV
jgi:hypothetical protein